MGVDPSLFAQALMYHAHRYSKQSWAGEPEINPLDSYEEREQVEGWELTPRECLELAYGGVLREKAVQAGNAFTTAYQLSSLMDDNRLEYRVRDKRQCIKWVVTRSQVCSCTLFGININLSAYYEYLV